MLLRKPNSARMPPLLNLGRSIFGISLQSALFVVSIAAVSVGGSVAMTAIQIGLVPSALKTAVLIPLLVSVPVSSWMAMQQSKVRRLNRELGEMVRRDPLTGVLNAPMFMNEVQQALPDGGLLMVCDVDRFKEVNDTFGHAAGDAAIKSIAESLTKLTGPQWLLGRLGGDEFGLFLRNTSLEEGRKVAECLHREAGRNSTEFNGSRIECTLSFGMHVLPPRNVKCAVPIADAIAAADVALYAAKSQGRDRLVAVGEEWKNERQKADFPSFESDYVQLVGGKKSTPTTALRDQHHVSPISQ